MADISNRTLATLLIAAIVVSLGGTLLSLNRLQEGVTGNAQLDTGTASVTVQQAVSIILQNPPGADVDFGTGRVNASKSGCSQRAQLLALDTGYSDVGDCWLEIAQSTPPTGWVVENDGNLNASVNIRGPSETSFFSSYPGTYPDILRWRVNVSDNGCLIDRNESWSAFDWNSTACNQLPWDEGQYDDDFSVEVNLTVPSDLVSSTYSDSNIEFYAIASVWS